MHLPALILTMQFLQMPVESLIFGEEGAVREVAIQDPNRIVFVQGGDQLTACILNCLEMARGDIAGSAGECEIIQFILAIEFVSAWFHSVGNADWSRGKRFLALLGEVSPIAPHIRSSNQFGGLEHQPSMRNRGHPC